MSGDTQLRDRVRRFDVSGVSCDQREPEHLIDVDSYIAARASALSTSPTPLRLLADSRAYRSRSSATPARSSSHTQPAATTAATLAPGAAGRSTAGTSTSAQRIAAP